MEHQNTTLDAIDLFSASYQLTTSGIWGTFKMVLTSMSTSFEKQLFGIESYDKELDRKRLVLFIQKQLLDKLVKDIESYSSEFINRQISKS